MVGGVALGEAIAGGLLVFFLPGFLIARATFPDWRLRGPGSALRILETVSLAFVLSVTLTVLVGVVLLDGTPAGFSAGWADPGLEGGLALIAVIALAVGWLRGAYSTGTVASVVYAPTAEGETGAWELDRELEALARQERRILHALRVRSASATEEAELREELDRVRGRQAELGRTREAQYATP